MSKGYSYEKSDKSIITPPFERYVVNPVLKVTPRRLPANIITLFSNLTLYAMVPLVLLNRGSHELLNYLLVPAGIFLYMVGDFIDGDQAVRTGTQSPLGEFLDHYLDSFNNGIIILYLWVLFDMSHPWLFAAYLGFSYLGGTSLVYEHFKRGVVHFGRFGTSEGLAMAVVVILAAALPPVRVFLQGRVAGGYNLFELVFLVLTVISYVPTFAQVVSRLGGIGGRFWFYLGGLAALSWVAPVLGTIPEIIAIVSLFSGVYIGRLIRARLLKGPPPFPDLVTPILGLCLAVVAQFLVFDRALAAGLLVVSGAVQVLSILVSTLYRYRHHWRWINPTA